MEGEEGEGGGGGAALISKVVQVRYICRGGNCFTNKSRAARVYGCIYICRIDKKEDTLVCKLTIRVKCFGQLSRP